MRGFQMGPWTVLPERGLLRNGDDEKRIEPLVMDVLVALAVGDGDVVSKDQLVQAAWGGRPVTDDVIVHSIAGLRKSLGDNARDPDYVENIPRRGYRLKTPVIVKSDGKAGPKAALDHPAIRRDPAITCRCWQDSRRSSVLRFSVVLFLTRSRSMTVLRHWQFSHWSALKQTKFFATALARS